MSFLRRRITTLSPAQFNSLNMKLWRNYKIVHGKKQVFFTREHFFVVMQKKLCPDLGRAITFL